MQDSPLERQPDLALPPEALADLVRALQEPSQDGRDEMARLCDWAASRVANASLDIAIRRMLLPGPLAGNNP